MLRLAQQTQPTHGRRKLAGWHQTSRAALAGIIQISLRNRESWTSSAVGFGSQSPSLTASPKRPLRRSACAASGSGPSSDLCTHERTTSARMPPAHKDLRQHDTGRRSEHRTERKGTARKGTRGRARACARRRAPPLLLPQQGCASLRRTVALSDDWARCRDFSESSKGGSAEHTGCCKIVPQPS
jgi:hypothetical protein